MNDPIHIGLRVAPGAARSGLVGRYGERWKVRIAAPAERGAANRALLDLLADLLALPRSALALVAGQRCADKLVAVRGLQPAELERRLGSALAARERA